MCCCYVLTDIFAGVRARDGNVTFKTGSITISVSKKKLKSDSTGNKPTNGDKPTEEEGNDTMLCNLCVNMTVMRMMIK